MATFYDNVTYEEGIRQYHNYCRTGSIVPQPAVCVDLVLERHTKTHLV